MNKISKDAFYCIIQFLSNKDKIALKLTCKKMYWRLISVKPKIEYSTIVHWRISRTDPYKEFSFEIKKIKSRNLRSKVTKWGQDIIDLYNECILDKCCLEYKPFCYDCALSDTYDGARPYCFQHQQNYLSITNEISDKIQTCGCYSSEIPHVDFPFENIVYPCERDGYNCSKMFHVIDDYDTTYYYYHCFFVYEKEEEFDTTCFCVVEH